jgi:diguanylate cyclase (GGDEF)-like protein
MKIYKYIRHKPFSVNYESNYTILELASLFLTTDNESIVILKDKKPIYIITNTDLINYFLQKDSELTVKQIMDKYPKNIILINKDEDIYNAYKRMRSLAIEHLLVIDDDGSFLGEVFQKDLVMMFVEYALKDELTGLNNSRFLETIIQKYNVSNTHIGVIFLDIDDFKHFNDDFGHKIGDDVIKAVADKIRDSIREVDFGFRYGGDEFVIMIFEQNKEVVLKIAQRIFDKISNIKSNYYDKIGVSIGVAMYPDDNKDLKEVIKLADKELYIAKNSGKGKIESVN